MSDPYYDSDPYNRPWQGDSRNSYSELWIILPIVIIASVAAILLVIPVLAHRYCKECCQGGFCGTYFSYFETCVTSCEECQPGMLRPGRHKRPEPDLYYQEPEVTPIPIEYTYNSAPGYPEQNPTYYDNEQTAQSHWTPESQQPQTHPWSSATYQAARLSRTQYHVPQLDSRGNPIRMDEIAMDFAEVKLHAPRGGQPQHDIRQYSYGHSAV